MAAGVVTVGGQRYAVGLYWENSPGGGRVTQIAREAANQTGQQADLYAIRPGNKNGRIPQFGLCTSEAGQTNGMPVLAACLATQVPGSWAGAFRLSEGVVVVIVRDDLIVPDGDLFFLDEAEARDRLLQEISFGGLQTIYAPESWSIPMVDTIPLTLLVGSYQGIRLQRVSWPKHFKIIAAALALVFVVGVAGLWYWQEKIDEDKQAQDALRAAQEQAKKYLPGQTQAVPEPVYVKTWETAPMPLSVLEACRKALTQIHAVTAGWNMGPLKCGSSGVSYSWARDKGFSAPPPGSIVSDTGQQATQSLPIPGLIPRGPQELGSSDVMTRRYLAQNWPGTIARLPDDPPRRRRRIIKAPGIRLPLPGLSVPLPLLYQNCLEAYRKCSLGCRES